MAKNYGLGSFNIHKSGKILLKINLELQWPLWGTFPLDKIVHLRSALESKCSQIKQNGIPLLIGMWKPPKGFKISK